MIMLRAETICPLFDNKLGCYEGHLQLRFQLLGLDNSRNYLAKLHDDGFLTQGQCHTLGHLLGQNAARAGMGMTEAMEEKGSFCGWAFFHGVMEGLFGDGAGHGRISVQEAWKICEEAPYKNNIESFNCFHALGHGFYSLESNPEKAFSDCDLGKDEAKKGFCYDGVFMAMTFPKEGPQAKLPKINGGEALNFCNNLSSDKQSYCFWRFLPITIFESASGMPQGQLLSEIDEKITPDFKSIFWNGIGRELDSRTASDITTILTICDESNNQDDCIQGAGMHMIFYDKGDTSRSERICSDCSAGDYPGINESRLR